MGKATLHRHLDWRVQAVGVLSRLRCGQSCTGRCGCKCVISNPSSKRDDARPGFLESALVLDQQFFLLLSAEDPRCRPPPMTQQAHTPPTRQRSVEPLTPRHLVEVVVEHHHLSPSVPVHRAPVFFAWILRSKANRMRGFSGVKNITHTHNTHPTDGHTSKNRETRKVCWVRERTRGEAEQAKAQQRQAWALVDPTGWMGGRACS